MKEYNQISFRKLHEIMDYITFILLVLLIMQMLYVMRWSRSTINEFVDITNKDYYISIKEEAELFNDCHFEVIFTQKQFKDGYYFGMDKFVEQYVEMNEWEEWIKDIISDYKEGKSLDRDFKKLQEIHNQLKDIEFQVMWNVFSSCEGAEEIAGNASEFEDILLSQEKRERVNWDNLEISDKKMFDLAKDIISEDEYKELENEFRMMVVRMYFTLDYWLGVKITALLLVLVFLIHFHIMSKCFVQPLLRRGLEYEEIYIEIPTIKKRFRDIKRRWGKRC